MITDKDILGVVLAGGLSRRMEGREKSLMKLGGSPLINGVAERLASQVHNVIINANGDADRFGDLGLPVQADTVEGFAGPLAGVLAGMHWAEQNSNASHILTAAADTPFFPKHYCKKMIKEADQKSAQIALAGSGGRHHPVFGLWPVALATDLKKFLVEEEGRKVMLFVERYANCRVDFDGETFDPFFNVNTPDDLIEAQTILGQLN